VAGEYLTTSAKAVIEIIVAPAAGVTVPQRYVYPACKASAVTSKRYCESVAAQSAAARVKIAAVLTVAVISTVDPSLIVTTIPGACTVAPVCRINNALRRSSIEKMSVLVAAVA
jgi:hypothetical protein